MRNEKEYIGNPNQLLEVKTGRMEGGLAQSVLYTDINCQSGISFTVLADRCMDISSFRYKGANISYLNPCGVVAPTYYDRRETQWLRSFTGGFLTTCGLDNTGSPCNENGNIYGLHGRISHIPAAEYAVERKEEKGEYTVILSGEMNQSSLFGEKLKLKRKIQSWQKRKRIEITDEICNCGFQKEEFMILYHCNIGYPFLTPAAEVYIESEGIHSRNCHSERYISEAKKMTEPAEVEEMCYYHEMKNYEGKSRAGIYQPQLGFGVVITYDNTVLKRFTQWKNLSAGQYVMGLEPGSNWVEGKVTERARDTIQSLEPQKSAAYKMIVEIAEGKEEFLNKVKD